MYELSVERENEEEGELELPGRLFLGPPEPLLTPPQVKPNFLLKPELSAPIDSRLVRNERPPLWPPTPVQLELAAPMLGKVK